MHHPTLCAVAVALLSALPGAQAGLYSKKSPVLQVDAKSYDRLIAKSNHTSVSDIEPCSLADKHLELSPANLLRSRLSNSMPHGAATARTFSQPTKRLPRTWLGSPR